jgi:hypothetical protein
VSPFATALCEASKRDDTIIVGSDVRALCMEIRASDATADRLAGLLRGARPLCLVAVQAGHSTHLFMGDIDAALAEYDAGKIK